MFHETNSNIAIPKWYIRVFNIHKSYSNSKLEEECKQLGLSDFSFMSKIEYRFDKKTNTTIPLKTGYLRFDSESDRDMAYQVLSHCQNKSQLRFDIKNRDWVPQKSNTKKKRNRNELRFDSLTELKGYSLDEMRLFMIDFECSWVSKVDCCPIEVACIAFKLHRQEEFSPNFKEQLTQPQFQYLNYHSLIRPPKGKYESAIASTVKYAFDIHGISKDKVELPEIPLLKDVMQDLYEWINDILSSDPHYNQQKYPVFFFAKDPRLENQILSQVSKQVSTLTSLIQGPVRDYSLLQQALVSKCLFGKIELLAYTEHKLRDIQDKLYTSSLNEDPSYDDREFLRCPFHSERNDGLHCALTDTHSACSHIRLIAAKLGMIPPIQGVDTFATELKKETDLKKKINHHQHSHSHKEYEEGHHHHNHYPHSHKEYEEGEEVRHNHYSPNKRGFFVRDDSLD